MNLFPLTFTNSILNILFAHQTYSFLKGLSDNNQVCRTPKEQENITLIQKLRCVNYDHDCDDVWVQNINGHLPMNDSEDI